MQREVLLSRTQNEGAMTVTATIRDGVFTIAGESEAEPGRFVYVQESGEAYDNFPELFFGPGLRVPKLGALFTVPVDGDGSDVLKIDASEVTGAGVEVDAFGDGLEVLGSRQNDVVLVFGAAVLVDAGGGADLILGASGGENGQTMGGGAGDDTIYAGDGDDVLVGGEGDDVLTGEEGVDVAVYSGARADYEVVVENGVYVVRDLRAGVPDGVDRIADVEQLRFSDGTVDLSPLAQGLTATVEDNALTVSGDGMSGGSLGFASDKVVVVSLFDQLFVRDGGELHPVISVTDDGSYVQVVDVRGVEGVGVDVTAYARSVRVFGSEQADDILGINLDGGSGLSRGVLLGHGGDDTIVGGGDRLYLGGGKGNDLLSADEGEDTLIGGRGDDTLDGDDGSDVALYSGSLADYTVTFENGAYVVTDLRAGKDGVDVLHGIERLEFADDSMTLGAPPSELQATVSEGVLTVSGEAASADGLVLIYGGDETIGDPRAEVVIDRDGSIARTIDARGVENGGAYIATDVASARVFGTEQDDVIDIVGDGRGRNVAQGGGGDDDIFGGSTRDELVGGLGNDTLYGNAGGDILTGGGGDDLIDGGSGADVAVYSGDRANYLIEQVYDYYRVTDLRPGYNGVDVILDIEQLQFKDGLFDVATLVTPPDDALFM